jgi:hypothetical protein
MSNKHKTTDSAVDALTNESARQRWELFHRAIAHAKESANDSLREAEDIGNDPEPAPTRLTVVR